MLSAIDNSGLVLLLFWHCVTSPKSSDVGTLFCCSAFLRPTGSLFYVLQYYETFSKNLIHACKGRGKSKRPLFKVPLFRIFSLLCDCFWFFLKQSSCHPSILSRNALRASLRLLGSSRPIECVFSKKIRAKRSFRFLWFSVRVTSKPKFVFQPLRVTSSDIFWSCGTDQSISKTCGKAMWLFWNSFFGQTIPLSNSRHYETFSGKKAWNFS